MPELPEVENMVLTLKKCQNQKIEKVYSSYKKLRKPIQQNLVELLVNTTITSIFRKAKYLIFTLSNNYSIVAHAGMSGKFLLSNFTHNNIQKHDHIILYLNNNTAITYNDPRRFGLFYITPSTTLEELFFAGIGVDALSYEFNSSYLQNKLHKISSNIKNNLLNQKIVAGIGNIYASEALFYSKINPTIAANSLTLKQLNTLIHNIKKVLEKSIKLGGSTLKDYKTPQGQNGNFQNHFAVYNRANQPCYTKECHHLIVKIIQNGRSTFYCPHCQK